jgi:hypothetical protein
MDAGIDQDKNEQDRRDADFDANHDPFSPS